MKSILLGLILFNLSCVSKRNSNKRTEDIDTISNKNLEKIAASIDNFYAPDWNKDKYNLNGNFTAKVCP